MSTESIAEENRLPEGASPAIPERIIFPVILALSACHLVNDAVQSVITALYPLLKESLGLDFTRIGLITLTAQLTASICQPVVGLWADRKPMPYALAFGTGFTLTGLFLIAYAASFPLILVAVGLIGIGSAIFHPEASRLAYVAAGQQRGFAQSFFQLGGNGGSSVGPLLAVCILAQRQIFWLSPLLLVSMGIAIALGHWQHGNLRRARLAPNKKEIPPVMALPRRQVIRAISVLLALVFSKYFYIASITSYYTFYLMGKFSVSIQNAQLHLFVFMAAVAAGTLIGGPVGDRYGRKFVIWCSILGTAPFSLALPHANLFWTGVLSVPIGIILSSAFSAIVVYAQELMPGRVGMVAGLFFGFAFGMGGIGSAVLGKVADLTSIGFVFQVCAFLPLIGLLTVFLPTLRHPART